MQFNTFAELFHQATGNRPFSYQERYALAEASYDLVHAPTGAGKTATVVLGWLWGRLCSGMPTPRRLVYCLPMRTLVEQTVASAQVWLGKLGLEDVRVHKLLGGDAEDDWAMHPECEAILVGTQDMLLSRGLNRGYAQGRFRWPIDFGLLNNDCLWVFDELQLMGSGVSTSAQMAGLREKLGGYGSPCRSVWMSATLEAAWLNTVDFRERITSLRKLELDDDELTTGELGKRMQAAKVLKAVHVGSDAADKKNYGKAVAEVVKKAHKEGTLTLVVLNTVDRAQAVFHALQQLKGMSAELMLLHSRFRPAEREELNKRLSTGIGAGGRIVISTQVVEAGVDISARVLMTELAPWPSLVQRFGRCHRYGEFDRDGGEVFWLDLPIDKAALPYSPDDLEFARRHLQRLNGKDVSPLALRTYQKAEGITLPFEHKHVLRRRDLLDLFDTAPDLSGNDIDIARFVRGDDLETDVSVFWRDIDPKSELSERWPRREELCPVGIGQIKEFLKGDGAPVAYCVDHLNDEWIRIDPDKVRPGMVLLLPCGAGGYDWDSSAKIGRGWCGEKERKPAPVLVPGNDRSDGEEGVGADKWSQGPAQTLEGHTQDVCGELKVILAGLDLPEEVKQELRYAAARHDLGKAHLVFQQSIQRANPQLPTALLWAKSGTNRSLRHQRKHFRHELASALAMLQRGASFFSVYLVGGHHGRVRLSIRSLPGEFPPDGMDKLFALGIHQGDHLPRTDLGPGITCDAINLDLSPMLLGIGSWADQAARLLRQFGPFRLAFAEALLRAADMRASNTPKTGVHHG